LPAIDRQHGGVQIEARRAGPQPTRAPVVVQLQQARQRFGAQPAQEPSQTAGMRIGVQAGDLLEDAVVAQPAGGLETSQPQQNRIEHGQRQLAKTVAAVALALPQQASQGATQL